MRMSRNDSEIWTKSGRLIRLGRLLFDPETRELREGDRPVELRKQSSEVLAFLTARPMETVGKDELIEAIWAGVSVTDDSLVQCIGDIRRTLGPAAKDCIQTVPRRGYRLVPSAPQPHPESVLSRPRALLPLALAVVVAAMLGVGAFLYIGSEADRAQTTTIDRPVVAVLPFIDKSQDPGQKFFIDGLSEDLATDLSRISGLMMISSASSFAAHDPNLSPEEIARSLGANFVVTGNVRRDGRRVRITATLVDVATGASIWADRYDRDIGGIFELQDDVSRSITSALAIQLTLDEEALFARQQTVVGDAYDLVLRGLAPLRTFTDTGIREARDYFRRAIEIDPDYARAHANLALTYGTSIIFRLGDDSASKEVALQEAQLAVDLEPRLPQAQFALAVVLLSERRHDQAIDAAREAIRLDPSYADGYAVLAQTLAYGGNPVEALSAIRTAKKLSPRFTFTYLWVEGNIFFQLRRYDEARAVLEEVVNRNPAFLQGYLTLAATYGHLGMTDEADWISIELAALAPDLSAFAEGKAAPYRVEGGRAHYVEGLLLAGLPD